MARSFSQEPRSDSHKIGETRYRMSHLPSTTAIARTLLLAGILLAVTVLAARSFFPAFAQDEPEEVEFYENSEEDVAVFAVSDPDGDTITWSLDGLDADDFSVTGDSVGAALKFKQSPNFEGPTDRAEGQIQGTDNMYHVTVVANDGTDTTNRGVIVTVMNVEEDGKVTMSAVRPKETVTLTATLMDPDGQPDRGTVAVNTNLSDLTEDPDDPTTGWQWATSTAPDGTFTDIDGAMGNTYMPDEGDIGSYLRVTVTYRDGHGVDDPDTFDVDESLDDPITFTFDHTVLRDEYVNDEPMFKDADGEVLVDTARKVAENSSEGTDVGKPVQATDPGEDGSEETLTYSLEGDDAALFTVENDDPSTRSVNEGGQIKVGANTPLDHETEVQASYEVIVRATDPSGEPSTIEVAIEVTDLNEAPEINAGDTVTEVNETTSAETQVGSVAYVAVDVDEDDTLTWTLTGNDSSKFNITETNNGDGILRFNEDPNYEAKADRGGDNKYNVTVKATDRGGLSDTREVVVEVVDVDEGDTTPTMSHRPAEGVVLTASINDPDGEKANIVWTWATSSPTFATTTGSLSTQYRPKSTDVRDTLTVTLTYDDKFGAKQPITFTTPQVLEENNNQAPVFARTTDTLQVQENVAAGTPVDDRAITATDNQHPSDLLYEFTTNSGDARFFNIVRTTGQITVGAGTELDRETDDTYTVTVRAKDPFGLNDTIVVTIKVTDVDEGPFITEPEGTVEVIYAEDRTDAVRTFDATDPEDDKEGHDLKWSLGSGGDNTNFKIGELDGVLEFMEPPSYEAEVATKVYRVTVTVTDNTLNNIGDPAGQTNDRTVEVTVTDVEEVGTITLPNLQPKQTIQLQATLNDPDGGPGAVIPLLANGTDLTEVQANDEPIVKWQWARSRNKRDWTDIGKMATSSSYTPVKDDVGSYLRVTAKYTDRRSETGDDPKTAEAITANVVLPKDYENEAPKFPDQDPDPDPMETDFSQKRKVAENSPKDTKVGSPVEAIDYGRDGVTKEPLIYELYNAGVDTEVDTAVPGTGDARIFAIDNDGQITVATTTLDYENGADANSDSVYEVQVKAIDPSMASTTIDLTIRVTNVDEAPKLATTTETEGLTAVERDENSASSTGLSVYRASDDEDDDSRLRWSLEGPDAGMFEFSATTSPPDNCNIGANSENCIELNFKQSPDFEARADADGNNVYNVTLVVTDRDEMTASRDVAVTVKNIEEYGKITLSNRVPEVGTAITASLNDPDGGVQGLSWKWYRSPDENGVGMLVIPNIVSDSYTPVEEDATNRQYLFAEATYTDNFRKDDDPGTVGVDESRAKDTFTQRSEFITQAMDDTNQPPVFPDQNAAQTRRVQEESPEGTAVVGEVTEQPEVTAQDSDDQNLTYKLGGRDAALFTIDTTDDPDTTDVMETPGLIRVGKGTKLDYDEGRRSYTVTVTATDPSDASATITVTIEVAPMNEAPMLTRRDVGVTGPRSVRHPEENNNDVATYNATGLEGTITWDVEGDDASDFSISSGGVLSFRSTPNFEAPEDADTDNEYNVTVKASAGGVSPTLAVTVSVINVDESGTVNLSSPGNEVKVGVQLTAQLDEGDEEVVTGWQWSSGGSNTGPWNNIPGETNNTYTPVDGDVGDYLRITVSYTDATFGSDSLSSVTASAVEATTVTVPGTAGSLTLSPTTQLTSGDTVTATLTDADNPVSQAWLWQRSVDDSTNWTTISAATSESYTTTNDDAGNYLRASVTYTDDSGANQTAGPTATANRVRIDSYDADADGRIDGPEVLRAVADYFRGDILGPRVLQVVALYFAGLS